MQSRKIPARVCGETESFEQPVKKVSEEEKVIGDDERLLDVGRPLGCEWRGSS